MDSQQLLDFIAHTNLGIDLAKVLVDIGYEEAQRSKIMNEIASGVQAFLQGRTEQYTKQRDELLKFVETTATEIRNMEVSLGFPAKLDSEKKELDLLPLVEKAKKLGEYMAELSKTKEERVIMYQAACKDLQRLKEELDLKSNVEFQLNALMLPHESSRPASVEDWRMEKISAVNQQVRILEEEKLKRLKSVVHYTDEIVKIFEEELGETQSTSSLNVPINATAPLVTDNFIWALHGKMKDSSAPMQVAEDALKTDGMMLSLQLIQLLEDRLTSCRTERQKRMQTVATLSEQLIALWNKMRADEAEREPLLSMVTNMKKFDLTTISYIQNSVVELENKKKKMLKLLVQQAYQELNEIADQFIKSSPFWNDELNYAVHTDDYDAANDIDDSEEAIEARLSALEETISHSRERLEHFQKITEHVGEREKMRAELAELEARAQDPTRLLSKRSNSISLMKEESSRKRLTKALVELNKKIRAKVKEYEGKYNEKFSVYDPKYNPSPNSPSSKKSYLEVIAEQEAEEERKKAEEKRRRELAKQQQKMGDGAITPRAGDKRPLQQKQQHQQQKAPRICTTASVPSTPATNKTTASSGAPSVPPSPRTPAAYRIPDALTAGSKIPRPVYSTPRSLLNQQQAQCQRTPSRVASLDPIVALEQNYCYHQEFLNIQRTPLAEVTVNANTLNNSAISSINGSPSNTSVCSFASTAAAVKISFDEENAYNNAKRAPLLLVPGSPVAAGEQQQHGVDK